MKVYNPRENPNHDKMVATILEFAGQPLNYGQCNDIIISLYCRGFISNNIPADINNTTKSLLNNEYTIILSDIDEYVNCSHNIELSGINSDYAVVVEESVGELRSKTYFKTVGDYLKGVNK